ncbi:MAG: right-handed parallel beta-helix repeat-containing protein, partial [Leptolyngbyaceae cyanobacterium SL_7_1]|nr:right-handed parallel beta-helix repeat-containing protein [Leptolyngbyaceae cyanobacterium SL_7_1]
PTQRGYGLWIESSSPTVTNSTFRGNTHDGITVNGNSTPIIQDNVFVDNRASGVAVFGTAQPQIRNNVFEHTGFGINVTEHATPLIIGNRITRNRNGIVVQESARPICGKTRSKATRKLGWWRSPNPSLTWEPPPPPAIISSATTDNTTSTPPPLANRSPLWAISSTPNGSQGKSRPLEQLS